MTCKAKQENNGVCPHHNLQCGWPQCNEPAQPYPENFIDALKYDVARRDSEQQCRTDGRCQYAIDSGAEGMGYCPEGKCVMPAQQEPVAWIYSHGKAKVVSVNYVPGVRATPLYTSPPAQRKPLPCETLRELWCNAWLANSGSGWFVISEVFARAIEAAHNIKEQS